MKINVFSKTFFIVLFTLLVSYSSFSQHPIIEWNKMLGGSKNDVANSIKQTNDGGYIIVGETQSPEWDSLYNGGSSDAYVLKLDMSGNVKWKHTFGGTGWEAFNSVCQTSDNGYIVAGFTASSDGDVTNNHDGFVDAWVIKLDTDGKMLWQKCYGGSNSEYANSIIQANDGGYVFVGSSDTDNNGDVSDHHGNEEHMDFWVVKLNGNGVLEWEKSLGGKDDEVGYDIQKTTDGGYIAVGYSESNEDDVSVNKGFYDYWVVKLNSIGSIQWQNTFGGSNMEQAYSVQQTNDGGYIVAGDSYSNDSDVTDSHGGFYSDVWIVKLNAGGNKQWGKSYGGTSEDDSPCIIKSNDGGYIIISNSISDDGDVSGIHGTKKDIWMIKLNDLGFIDWQECIGSTGTETFKWATQTSEGGYIIAGSSDSNDSIFPGNHGLSDAWIVKLSSTVGMKQNDELTTTTIKICPNPFFNSSNIELQTNMEHLSSDTRLVIYDVMGRTVKTFGLNDMNKVDMLSINAFSVSISKNDFNGNGLFYYTLYSNEQRIVNGKFVLLE